VEIQKNRGFLKQKSPRKGIGHPRPLDLKWMARIRQGRKERVWLAGGEREHGGAAIVNGKELAGVTESGATGLGFQIQGYREEAEMKTSSRQGKARPGDGSHGACHDRW
jgi:hypothetical protein